MIRAPHLSFAVTVLSLCLATGDLRAGTKAQDPVSFRIDISPILLQQCQSCHGPEKSKGKYRLDTFNRLLHPGKSKDATIVAGEPQESALFRRITSHDKDERMPQKADPLPAMQVELIRRWIEEGAKFDGPDRSATLASVVPGPEEPAPPEAYREHVPITALAFSPDGRTLAASGYHEITLWDPMEGKLLGRIQKLPERTWGLSWSPDGKLLAAACGMPGVRGEVRLCDPVEHVAVKVLDRIADMMLVVRFSPDGNHLAAGGADNALRVYEVESGKRELLIEQHADWVTDLAFSPDGSRIVTASRDKSARVFDARTGATDAAYLGHEEPVFGATFSDDGKTIFSAGRDRKIHAWSATDAKAIGQITITEGDPLKLLAFDGHLFGCATGGSVCEYSQGDRQRVRVFAGASDWVYCLALEPAHHRLAGGCYDGRVRIWDSESGEAVQTFLAAPGLRPSASAAVGAPDGDRK
jgi:WD40 repeat protein